MSAFFWDTGFNFSIWLPWFAAVLLGAWVAQSLSDEERKRALQALKYRASSNLAVEDRAAFRNEIRGITSSLGPVPIHEQPLLRIDGYSFNDLKTYCPRELLEGDLFERLLGTYQGPTARTRHPAHVAVFDALAATLLHPEYVTTPAGIDRHGGRCLLMHTLLVLGLMAQRAQSHLYMPGHGRRAINDNFKLDPNDPLIPILALAHDLGKIRKMVIEENGVAVALLPGHDAQAARDLAQLPELWRDGISPEDRRILFVLLSHYGHQSTMPVKKMTAEQKPTVTSDRLHALAGLLAECDRLAGSIELGRTYRFDQAPASIETAEPLADVVEPVNLFNALARFFVVSMPVNARSPMKSVGFKRKDEEFTRNRDVVIIDELEFVKAFSAFLEKPELSARDGKSSSLTKMVLELLDEHGFLFRFDEGPEVAARPATSCLYKIAFHNSDAREGGEPSLVLSSAFIVDVSNWPNMAKLQGYPNCLSTPSFAGFRLGRQASKIRRSADDSIAAETLGGDVEAVGVDVTRLIESGKGKKLMKPEQVIQKIGQALFGKAIKVAAEDATELAVADADDFFRGLGLPVEHFDDVPGILRLVGITQIKRSVRDPATHVVRLDRTMYDRFVPLKSLF